MIGREVAGRSRKTIALTGCSGKNVMIFVCPKPMTWSDAYQRLLSAWEASGRQGEPPPGPLILSNWVYSSDRAKQDRWRETIEWAERNSCRHLLPSLTEDDRYYTHCLSTSYPGQNWGNQVHPPAERPTDSVLAAALQRLRDEWATIAGPVSAAGFTVTCNEPGRFPEAGVTVSQLAPEFVMAVAVKVLVAVRELTTETVCETGTRLLGANV